MDTKRKFGRFFMLMVTSFLLFTACSFAPENTLNSTRPADFPDMKLENTRYLLGLEGLQPIQIHAAIIEIYQESQQAFITEASFTQHDEQGHLIFSGTFGFAIIDTDTNNLVMSKGVYIENHQNIFTIEADQLDWDNEERIAIGERDTLVTLTLHEHDILQGTGFTGDLKTATFEFLKMEKGRLHYE